MQGRKLTNLTILDSAAAYVCDGGSNTAIVFILDQDADLTFANLVPGELYAVSVAQDASGYWTLTQDGGAALPIAPEENSRTNLLFIAQTPTSVALLSASTGSSPGAYSFAAQGSSPAALVQGALVINQCDGAALIGQLPAIDTGNNGVPVLVSAGSNGMALRPAPGDTVFGQESLYIPAGAFCTLIPYAANDDWVVSLANVAQTVVSGGASLQYDTVTLGTTNAQLPDPALGAGRTCTFVNVPGTSPEISPFTSENINGASLYTCDAVPYFTVRFTSDGTDWIADPTSAA